MRIVTLIFCLTILSSIGYADDVLEMAEEFFEASEALDREYRDGKLACQRRYSFKNAPERDSAKYQRCLVDFDAQFQKKKCAFYVTWYERSRKVGGLVRPENYPQCTKYNY